MRKTILILILTISISGLVILFLHSGIGGDEDTWLCQNDQWVKHGQPLATQPIGGCGKETMTIKLFFNNSRLDPEFSCNKVFPVERVISKTPSLARAALELLLAGPTLEEQGENFFTSINSGVKIQALTIENGVALVDFDDQMEFQVGGSCRVSAIRSQITQTLKQFLTVQEVIISINGRTEDILQP